MIIDLLIGLVVVAVLGTLYVRREARMPAHTRRMLDWIAMDCPPDMDEQLADRERAA